MNADEEARDAHLRSALKHAPDAALGPAPALSEAILKEARAKARSAAPVAAPKRSNAWLAAWDWLARPSIASGFAGMMVAVVLGMMWWDRPMDEALPQRPSRAAPAVVAAPAAPPTPAPEPTEPDAAKSQPPAELQKPSTVRPSRAAAESKDAVQPHPVEAEKIADKKKDVQADTPAEPTSALAQDKLVAAEAARAPAAMAAPAPSAQAPARAAADEQVAGGQASPSVAAESRSAAPPVSASAKAFAPQARAARERAAENPAALAAPTISQSPSDRNRLFALRTELANDPSQWAWQRADGAAHSMDDALLAWLTQLDDSVKDAWQPRNAEPTAARGRELRLVRNGRVLHTLRITGNAVLWDREDAPPVQALLSSAKLQSLQAALDAAVP